MIQDLLLIQQKDFWKKIDKLNGLQGGVYKIISIRDGQRIPVNRFLGTDNDGVLYIGKATSFIDRVIELKKSISPDYNGKGHICGIRYEAKPNIAQSFPYDTLFVELLQTDTQKNLNVLY